MWLSSILSDCSSCKMPLITFLATNGGNVIINYIHLNTYSKYIFEENIF